MSTEDSADAVKAFGEAIKRDPEGFKAAFGATSREQQIRNEEHRIGVRAEAQARHLKKQGEAEFSAQISAWAPVSMVDLLRTPPEGAEPLVWMPSLSEDVTYVLATCKSVNRLAGGNKSGKSRLIASYIHARITGKPMLDFYQVKPADPDAVVVVLDAEQSKSSAYVEWRAYLGDLTVDQQRRVVWVPLRGLSLNVFNPTVRDGIARMVWETMVAQGVMDEDGEQPPICDLVLDPLFGFLPPGSDQIHDPTLATALYNEVLVGWAQHSMEADNVWVNAHTSVQGGKTGAEVKVFGSVGFDSKFEALWYLQRKDQNDEGPRLFGAQPGRDDTFAPPVHVHLDRATGRLYAEPSTMDKAYAEHKGRAERASSAEQKNEATDSMVESYIAGENALGKKPTTNQVYKHLKSKADADIADGKDPKTLPYFYSKTGTTNALGRLDKVKHVKSVKVSGRGGTSEAWEVVSDAE